MDERAHFWRGRSPASAIAVPNNRRLDRVGGTILTFRTIIPVRQGGRRWSFWYQNRLDRESAADAFGPADPMDAPGTPWRILSAAIADGGLRTDGSVEPRSSMPVLFGGSRSRDVAPGEAFWSDEAELPLPAGHRLVFTWTVDTGATGGRPAIPCAVQSQYAGFSADGDRCFDESGSAFVDAGDWAFCPNLTAVDRGPDAIIGFLGDSITQGYSSGKRSGRFWVNRVAGGLDSRFGIWNLGCGWGRAVEAAQGRAWIEKAQRCDAVALCLGVNDVLGGRTGVQILGDIAQIIHRLKEDRPQRPVILLTIPPFNFTGEQEAEWRIANRAIRERPPASVAVFDIAEALSQTHPHDNLLRPEYDSLDYNHPNEAGHGAIAACFLECWNALQLGFGINIHSSECCD